MTDQPDLKELRLDHFTPCVDDSFQCRTEDAGTLHLHLVEAEEIPTAKKLPEDTRKEFSLLFKGPADTPLTQGLFTLEHDDLGSHALFLVPVSQDDEHRYYEAVFA